MVYLNNHQIIFQLYLSVIESEKEENKINIGDVSPSTEHDSIASSLGLTITFSDIDLIDAPSVKLFDKIQFISDASLNVKYY